MAPQDARQLISIALNQQNAKSWPVILPSVFPNFHPYFTNVKKPTRIVCPSQEEYTDLAIQSTADQTEVCQDRMQKYFYISYNW